MNEIIYNNKFEGRPTYLIATSLTALTFFSILISSVSGIALVNLAASLLLVSLLHNRANSTFLAIATLLAYASLSGIIFGGFHSAITSGVPEWLSGEGRFFLYFAPSLAIILVLNGKDLNKRFIAHIDRTLLIITLLYTPLCIFSFTGINVVFSSHHAAGAIGSCLALWSYSRFSERRDPFSFLTLLYTLIGLLGSDSRTSLLATIIIIASIEILSKKFVPVAIGAVTLLLSTPVIVILYPEQVDRLSGAFEPAAYSNLASNFDNSLQRDWTNSYSVDAERYGASISGDRNLALRGVIWGRAFNEGLNSPILGTGFGRFNDYGRDFQSIGIGEVVIDADIDNPTVMSAHNTLLHLFTELGILGLALVGIIFHNLIKPLYNHKLGLLNNRHKVFVFAGLAYIAISGMTQLSVGAPIYGWTVFYLMCVSSMIVRNQTPFYDQIVK